jgi:hypothetical protein
LAHKKPGYLKDNIPAIVFWGSGLVSILGYDFIINQPFLRSRKKDGKYVIKPEVGEVISKCNGVTRYRLCLFLRAITFSSDNG